MPGRVEQLGALYPGARLLRRGDDLLQGLRSAVAAAGFNAQTRRGRRHRDAQRHRSPRRARWSSAARSSTRSRIRAYAHRRPAASVGKPALYQTCSSAVFARRDVHPGRRRRPHLAHAGQVVGRDRLLEPADIGLRLEHAASVIASFTPYAPFASTNSCAPSPIANFATATRRGSSPGCVPIFIFTQRQPSSLYPATELPLSCWSSIGGEPAAAVDRHLRAVGSEQAHERQFEQLGLQVPQRRVDRGDRRRRQPCRPMLRTARCMADSARRVHRVPALDALQHAA